MSAPLMPPLLEEVGRRRFAFYPPIANAEPNEWQLRGATRTEVNAINTRTELEIWIPRHYLGTVSEIDDPILIVGLTKELEYREGAVWPRVRRVIEMPRAVNEKLGRGSDPALYRGQLPWWASVWRILRTRVRAEFC